MESNEVTGISRRGILRAGSYGLAAIAVGGGVLGSATAARAAQSLWQFCGKCQGLWFTGNGRLGACPAGSGHLPQEAGSYTLQFVGEGSGQADWWWCTKCEGLWFAGNGNQGRCPLPLPEEPGHVNLGGQYRLEVSWSNNGLGGQREWRWCNKCQGLWFSGHRDHPGNIIYGHCPVSGGHNLAGSGDYILR